MTSLSTSLSLQKWYIDDDSIYRRLLESNYKFKNGDFFVTKLTKNSFDKFQKYPTSINKNNVQSLPNLNNKSKDFELI